MRVYLRMGDRKMHGLERGPLGVSSYCIYTEIEYTPFNLTRILGSIKCLHALRRNGTERQSGRKRKGRMQKVELAGHELQSYRVQ